MWYHGAEGSSEVEDMDTSDTSWYWFYLADCGRWHRFEDDPVNPSSTEDIESFYLRDPKGVLNIGNNKLDFSAMIQTDIKTGRQRRIERSYQRETNSRCCCFASVPVFWDTIDPKLPYQIAKTNVNPKQLSEHMKNWTIERVSCLERDTAEYTTVADFFKNDGMMDRCITSICRIQNLDLWEFFCRKKIQMERIQGVTDIKERRLFHGTSVSNIHTICTYNFDCRLAGVNGHSYGKGTYFARYATYADKYSQWNTEPLQLYGEALQGSLSQRTKVIFLARVIVGKSRIGDPKFLKPDHKNAINSHDSCVDSTDCPKIFVIFDSNQIYPEYLIQYY